MRIIHFIVTYKNNSVLEKAINSVFETSTSHDRSVFVIANHSQDDYSGPHPVKFLRNETRPDFSTGHLSRNWNQCLINGFRSLKQPEADLLVLSQNDCVFAEGYLDRCIELHQTLDLITYGDGDNCVSYSPRAVARVGLWDERFCNIGYQEADYFLRAARYLKERASINDGAVHGREFNPVQNVDAVIKHVPSGFVRKEDYHLQSMQFHKQSLSFFHAKWGQNPEKWQANFAEATQRVNNFIYYPYFENGIETLTEQLYLAFF